MNTRKTGMFRLLTISLILAMMIGIVPGIAAFAQSAVPQAPAGFVPTPTFADVPVSSWAYTYVETFYHAGLTTGCNVAPYRYCPDRAVTRAEIAVFILRALNGLATPTPTATGMFADVPTAGKEWMEPWIEQFYNDGLTTGCALNPFRYCPERTVTRAEIAVFILRALYGASYQPPAVTVSSFSDVPVAGKEWMLPWIEEFYNEKLTTGCRQTPTLQYCPEQGVTRAEAATFLVRAFNIVDPRGVAAEDFSVMNFSGVVGYNVGFHLVNSTFADVADVTVNLYNGTTLLATNTATPKFFTDFASGTIQSSPFDVLGTFDYVTDGYWVNSGWAGETYTLPTKAEIIVTFKNGLVRTAENTNLTGDTSPFVHGDVVAQDFGVMDFSNVKGYTVGFGLVDAAASDMTGVVVKLYNGTTVLATATATGLMANYPTATSLSAPFDVLGTFDYGADGNWSYSGWLAYPVVIPNKAEITVTFANGLVKTATNTNLTGDLTMFAPVHTLAATGVTYNAGWMNGQVGPQAVTGRSFWISASPITIPADLNRPPEVYASIDYGALAANTLFSVDITKIPGGVFVVTPATTYYYVAWVKIDGLWYYGDIMTFTTDPAPVP